MAYLLAYLPPFALLLWAACLRDTWRSGSDDVPLREMLARASAFWLLGVFIWYVWRIARWSSRDRPETARGFQVLPPTTRQQSDDR